MTAKTTRDILHETALKAPQSSGVYLWRNAEGTVIYVGKAKSPAAPRAEITAVTAIIRSLFLIQFPNIT